MILCDIGNTTYHFNIDGIETKYFLGEDLPCFHDVVYYVSVNDTATKKLKHNNETCVNIEKYIDFETNYDGMGLDRKVACIGAKDAIIVDAGSAITVDVIKKGKHKGGFILPGLKHLVDLYPKISYKLEYDFNPKVNLDKIPLCTQDAISYAILKSIIEPIKKVSKKREIIFTGGDGEFLSKYLKNSTYKEDLIFENMKRIIDANHSLT